MLKRFFHLGYNAWKKRKQSGTYLNFYMRNPDDSRNKLARILDFAGILLVIWLVSFTLLAGITKNQKALLLSGALLIVTLVLTDIIKRRQLQKKLLHTRIEMARQKHNEELEEMSHDEFYNYAKKLLEKKGISFKNETAQRRSLEATLGRGPVLVKFLEGEAITPSRIQAINKEINENDFYAAILVIKEDAHEEINTVLENYSDNYIEIVDKERLAKFAINLEEEISSAAENEDFSQLEQHQEKVRKWEHLKNEIIGNRKKTKSYTITGSILILLSIFWQSNIILSIIYTSFGIINITLAIISYYLERQKTKVRLIRP